MFDTSLFDRRSVPVALTALFLTSAGWLALFLASVETPLPRLTPTTFLALVFVAGVSFVFAVVTWLEYRYPSP